jgi:hypothetical protein
MCNLSKIVTYAYFNQRDIGSIGQNFQCAGLSQYGFCHIAVSWLQNETARIAARRSIRNA